MKSGHVFFECALSVLVVSRLTAQAPVLGAIDSPYRAIQATVHIAGGTYGPGAVSYGPVGTPLVLTGTDLGDSGTVEFIAYKNGVPDPNDQPVRATVTLWTPTALSLSVPSGALSGLVKVISEGATSNGVPFIVTAGAYSGGSCPAGPSQSQLQITTSSLDDGKVGLAYSANVNGTGGTTPYTWSIVSGALPGGLTLNSSSGVITGTPTAAYGPSNLTVKVTDSSSPTQSTAADLSLTITSSQAVIYSYSIPSYVFGSQPTGYDAVGNIVGYTDSVMGTWSMKASGGSSGYDTLNRLVAAQATGGPYAGLLEAWSYDDFGNRKSESFSGTMTSQNPPQIPAATSVTPASNNQIAQVVSGSNTAQPLYDAAGDYTCDNYNTTNGCLGPNQYLYDAEGRICAVNSVGIMTGYIYDADGNRVAKGTINQWSCNTATNGFNLTTSYILTPSNQQLTELVWNFGLMVDWRTNIWTSSAGLIGHLSEDLDQSQSEAAIVNFRLTDWLGTLRALTDSVGNLSATCLSLPYGDGENNCYSATTDATEFLFTGKERDSESGNDYFDARYYASNMGRFMSPDWSAKEDPVPYAQLDDPQSLNLYSYVRNNPLGKADPDGHCPQCLIWGEQALEEAADSPAGQAVEGWVVAGFAAAGSTIAAFGGDAVDALKTAADNGSYGVPGPYVGPLSLQPGVYHQDASAPAASQQSAPAPASGQSTPANPGPNGPYKRPNNATTQEQRDSVQGKPCSTCGATGQKNVANHIDPLVEQHYRGGIDPAKMHDPNAVNAQCPTCSAQQGGFLRSFSQAMKKLFGF